MNPPSGITYDPALTPDEIDKIRAALEQYARDADDPTFEKLKEYILPKVLRHLNGGGELEICTEAAIWLPKQHALFTGHRHPDCLKQMAEKGITTEERRESIQGFMTNRHRFVDRVEGRKLQETAGIDSASPDGYRTTNELFSEDLY